MGRRPTIGMGLVPVLVLAALLWTGAMAQTSDCNNVLSSLLPCLTYVMGNSSSPSSSCCTQLESIVQSEPQCLCQAVNLGSTSVAAGLNINQSLALGLPSACNIQTPSISSCNATSPAGAPESQVHVPSGTGSGTDPPPESGSTNSAKLSISMLFFVLFASSVASTFGTQ